MSNLITLEGLDGSGKSTVWSRLKERYADTDVVFTREPTQDTWYGEAVYQSIGDDEADELAELFLYLADHANHLQSTIRPALADGTPVISDRYLDSRIAYQAATLSDYHNMEDVVAFIDNAHRPWSRFPDTTVYLDISPETGVERSGATNKFEQREHLAAVRENYNRLRSTYSDRFVSIDGEGDPNQSTEESKQAVFERVCEVVDPLVNYER